MAYPGVLGNATIGPIYQGGEKEKASGADGTLRHGKRKGID